MTGELWATVDDYIAGHRITTGDERDAALAASVPTMGRDELAVALVTDEQ